jgi:glycosyltransferase involved in cell wall biosynthesis
MTGSGGKISIVVPTRNEAGNIGPLVRRITQSAGDVVDEVIFVDDSDDKTPSVIERVAASSDTAVRLIHRINGERVGALGGAVLEGISAAKSDLVVVMDGDLQHPPEVIPDLLAAADGRARVVVASRHRSPDPAGDGSKGAVNAGPLRSLVTNVATGLTRLLFPRKLAGITDPLTGFFLIDRRALPSDLQPDGFKILLEILARGRDLRPVEIGFQFGDRVSGRSKASLREGIRFARLLLRLKMSIGRSRSRKRSATSLEYRYDVHGVMSIASAARLPELEWFRTDAPLDHPDITVRIGKPSGSTVGLDFSEWFGWAGFAVRIDRNDGVEIHASRLVGRSPHVLYTNVVEPVLRWEFVRRGYALVHSACVVRDDFAYLVTARTDTGKTTTALKLLEERDLEFLSDDLSLVCPDGRLLTYPKPMTMSYHTVQAVNPDALSLVERIALQPQSRLHSRSGRRVGLGLAKSAFPAATANALVQWLVPPPKYPVTRILPGTTIADSGLPVHLFVIARGEESKRSLDWEEATELLLANCEDAYGFPPYERIEAHLLGVAEEDLRLRESEVILEAMRNCPATLLQSDRYSWATEIRLEIEADGAMRQSASQDDADAGGVHLVIDLTEKADRLAAETLDVVDEHSSEAAG